jgi:mannosyltransferase
MSAAAERRASPTAAVILVGGLFAIGLGLRLLVFGGALWGDELSTNFVVNGFGVADFPWLLRHSKEATPPLFFLLTWVTKGFDGAEGLRLVSLLASVAAIPLTYLLGVETVGRRGATVGAALVALSPFQIFYATEARAYALLMLTCLVASYALVRALSSGRTSWWAGYGVASAAAMYTHYAAVFVLLGLFAWAFIAHPEARRPLIVTNLAAALVFVPWIPAFVDDTSKQAARNIEPAFPLTLTNAVNAMIRMWFAGAISKLSDLPGSLALTLIGTSVAVGTAGLVLRASASREWRSPSAGVVLVIVLALASPLGAALHNVVALSIFTPRNLIASWPGFALSLGALVTAGAAPLRRVAVVLLLAGFGIGALELVEDANRRPDMEGAARFIESTGEPGAPVVDVPQFSPGPQMAMEAALAPAGAPVPPDRLVFELGAPTLAERLDVNRRGKSFDLGVPPVAPEQVARQVTRIAGDGTVFVVATPQVPIDRLRLVPGPLARFLSALPRRFHEIDSKAFPGPSIAGLEFGAEVHVLSGKPRPER